MTKEWRNLNDEVVGRLCRTPWRQPFDLSFALLHQLTYCRTKCSDLIFIVRCRHGNAQPRRALRYGWITNRRDKEAFIFKCSGEIERRLLFTHDPRENRAARLIEQALGVERCLPALKRPTSNAQRRTKKAVRAANRFFPKAKAGAFRLQAMRENRPRPSLPRQSQVAVLWNR